jgi:hypothetical protein
MKPTPCLVLIILLSSFIFAIDYQTDRMNFPPDESRTHNQTITNTATSTIIVNATIPSGFNLTSTDCTQISPTYVSCSIPANSTKYYTMTSPINCTETTLYYSQLTGNLTDKFTFVCIPDNKITDCKVEYGHGDANYLDQLYISNETAAIFNLIRVWNIGHYLSPDEPATDATVTCYYEKYPVITYGRVEIEHDPSQINGTFYWSEIESGYWFRIGVVSQEVSNKSIGDYYNITCTNLTYQYQHHRVIAESTTCPLEIRTMEPFTFTLTDHPTLENKTILTISNTEEYSTYDISFDKLLDSEEHTETYQQLDSGESVSYVIDETTACNSTLFFIPSWYINSWTPEYYTQQIDCSALNHPPTLDPIGNLTGYLNVTFTFDVNATDIDGDNLTFTDNTTLFNINPTTGLINFTPNATGNYSVQICVHDPANATDCEDIVIEILVSPPAGIGRPVLEVNLNPDNISVDLNWTNVSADTYNIYISTDPNNFSSTPNVTGITDLNWTDINANNTQQLFYKVEAVKGPATNMSLETGCKYTYFIISSSDTLRGKNLITLACNRTIDAETFLLLSQNSSYLTQLNRWDNAEVENFQSHPKGSTVNNYSMALGRGYLMFTTENNSFTLTGYAINSSVTLDLIASADSLKGKNYVGLPFTQTGHTAETFVQGTINGSYITQLNRWDNPEVENYQSHPRGSTVNNFTMDVPGRGYLFFTTENETYTPS